MKKLSVFFVFLLVVPLHAQGVFVKEMPDGFHLNVKHALVNKDILVAKSIKDATLIVDGYGRLTRERWRFGKFKCTSVLEFTTKDGDVVWRQSKSSYYLWDLNALDSCAYSLVWNFVRKMEKKDALLLISITKESKPI